MYVSLKYQKIVKTLYKRLGIKTVLSSGSAEKITEEGKTVFRTEDDTKALRSVYMVDIGIDVEKRLKDLLFSIKRKGISVLALYIPTDLVWSVLAMDSADRLGMIFSGIFPAGDFLLFHYFNGIAIDFDAIRLIPDNGQDLLELIQKEYEQKIF